MLLFYLELSFVCILSGNADSHSVKRSVRHSRNSASLALSVNAQIKKMPIAHPAAAMTVTSGCCSFKNANRPFMRIRRNSGWSCIKYTENAADAKNETIFCPIPLTRIRENRHTVPIAANNTVGDV